MKFSIVKTKENPIESGVKIPRRFFGLKIP